MKATGVSVVFRSKKSSELKTGDLKITIEFFFQALSTNLVSKFSKRGKLFMKIRTLQFEIQRLKNQTMIDLSKNFVSPSELLFKKVTHVERAGSVLYVHKCSKMIATITKLPLCTEEIPVLGEGQNFSSFRYMDPIT